MSLETVYFIQCETTGRVKIGRTSGHPDKRYLAIALCCPTRLRKLGVIRQRSAAASLEAVLHVRFGAWRVHGEWFEDAPELMDYIASAAKPWPVATWCPTDMDAKVERNQSIYRTAWDEHVAAERALCGAVYRHHADRFDRDGISGLA